MRLRPRGDIGPALTTESNPEREGRVTINLRESIEIHRPVEEVYDYVVNVENVQKWQPAVSEVKRLTAGPIRVGTKFSEVAMMMGRRIQTTCEITHLEPNSTVAWNATSDGPMEYQTTYTFEAIGSSTRLKIAGAFRGKGLWRLLEPILKGELKKESRHELAAMKAIIESRAL